MVHLSNEWTSRCAKLAAGATSIYLCHKLYEKRNIFYSDGHAVTSDKTLQSQTSGSLLGKTKEAISRGFKKAASVFRYDEESMIEELTSYIDELFERQLVKERFPAKPQVIPPSDVQFLHGWSGKKVCIGSGQMGAVYLAHLKSTGQKVAVKMATDRRCDINFMVHEASLLTHLNDTLSTPICHGLMPLRSGNNQPKAALVMDLVGANSPSKPMDLDNFLSQNKDRLNSADFRSLFTDITEKIGRIHAKGVVINDIKEANIMVFRNDGKIETRIIDFGSSRFGDYTFGLDKFLTKEVYMENFSHMAPEIFDKHKVSPVSDVYSLSSIFCEAGKLLGFSHLMFVGIKCSRKDPETRPNIEKVLKLLAEKDLEYSFGF